MTEEKLETGVTSEKAKTINTIITITGFAIGIWHRHRDLLVSPS